MTENKNSWLKKYRPNKLEDVLGDKIIIKKIEKFLEPYTRKKINYDIIKNPNLIITGTNGTGKSLIVDLILEKMCLEKVTANFSCISIKRKKKKKTEKNDKDDKTQNQANVSIMTFYKTLYNKKFTSMIYNAKSASDIKDDDLLIDGLETSEEEKNNINLSNKTYKHSVLVIDDVSNIPNGKEKDVIKMLVKLNNKQKKIPIIIITKAKHNKMVNELKKMASYTIKQIQDDGSKKSVKIINEILLSPPDYNSLVNFIKNICKLENIKLSSDNGKNNSNDDEEDIYDNCMSDDDIYTRIINHTQNDMRRLINTLEELKMIYGKQIINIDIFRQYCKTSIKKDMDPGIFSATKVLLNQYINVDYALSFYGEERTAIPLMVHENYPMNIAIQYPKLTKKKQIEIICNVAKSISQSDRVDGLIYSNQCWNLQTVHGFYSCVLPSYYINKNPDKLSIIEYYKYTQDYNKTSITRINNKVIKKAQENPFLKKVSINDFMCISLILKTLCEREDFEKLVELARPYCSNEKEIDSIIKIDKIKVNNVENPKKKLNCKQKKYINDMLLL